MTILKAFGERERGESEEGGGEGGGRGERIRKGRGRRRGEEDMGGGRRKDNFKKLQIETQQPVRKKVVFKLW